MENRKIVFRLKYGAKPHLFITDIKVLIEEDGYLSENMRKVLLLMKKSRMPYIILGTIKELVVCENKQVNLDRALQPSLTGFTKTNWSENDKKSFKEGRAQFYVNVMKLYDRLGYEKVDEQLVDDKAIEEILKTVKQDG